MGKVYVARLTARAKASAVTGIATQPTGTTQEAGPKAFPRSKDYGSLHQHSSQEVKILLLSLFSLLFRDAQGPSQMPGTPRLVVLRRNTGKTGDLKLNSMECPIINLILYPLFNTTLKLH